MSGVGGLITAFPPASKSHLRYSRQGPPGLLDAKRYFTTGDMAVSCQHLPMDSVLSRAQLGDVCGQSVRCALFLNRQRLGPDRPEVLNSNVDRVPSTRKLNFILTAKSGPCTVALIVGDDSTNTAWARTTRGTSTTTTATAIIAPVRTRSRTRKLRSEVFISCWIHFYAIEIQINNLISIYGAEVITTSKAPAQLTRATCFDHDPCDTIAEWSSLSSSRLCDSLDISSGYEAATESYAPSPTLTIRNRTPSRPTSSAGPTPAT